MKLTEFILSHIPVEQREALKKYGLLDKKDGLSIYGACYFHTNLFPETIKKFPFLPKLVNHNQAFDADHDHGAWTEQVVYQNGDKLIAFEIEFYGQGDTDRDPVGYEVKPRTITTIVYDKV
jgi:hypothetical protein